MEVWTPDLEKKYLKMYGGSKAEVERIKKTYKQNVELDARVEFTLFVYDLQNAGFPLKSNDLTLEQWQWLSAFKRELNDLQYESANKR